MPAIAAQTFTVTPASLQYSPGGGEMSFTVNLSYPADVAVVSFHAKPPGAGWKFVSTGGSNVPQISPVANDTTDPADPLSVFGWAYQTVVPNSASFTFVVQYPAGLTGSQNLSFGGNYRINSTSTVVTTPSIALSLTPEFHTADTNVNAKIDASELSRLIVLYNTRFTTPEGKVRTGSYRVQSGTVDGFGSDTTREPTTVATLDTYHSADTNRNGRIDAAELSRVIVLYNTRFTTPEGKVRTGFYKTAVGAATVDGYTTDPLRAP